MRSSSSQSAPMMPPRFMVPMASRPSRAPSQRQLLKHVSAGEDAVDAGPRQRAHEPVEQREAVGHGERVATGGEHAARGVVGGEDQQPAVGSGNGASARARRRAERSDSGSNTRASISAR